MTAGVNSFIIAGMSQIVSSSYTEAQSFEAVLRDQGIHVVSRPGLSHWNEITPATSLLAENILIKPNDQTLLLGCGHGALAVSIARRAEACEPWLMDTSLLALECTRLTLEANGNLKAHLPPAISLLPDQAGTFDCVVMENPKGRNMARRWLVEAHGLLKPEGRLYLAGSNDEGIQTVIRDGQELFGKAVLLGYKKGHRVALLSKSSPPPKPPAWRLEAGIEPGSWVEFDCQVGFHPFHFYSLPGVFSYDRLDEGTTLLLDNLDISPGARLLDVGCGYGVIGLSAAYSAHPTLVDMVDSNLLAVASARRNLELLGAKNVRILPSDLLSAVSDQQYTHILSNPPFHTGKEVNYGIAEALINQSFQALISGGWLILVANQFIHYERLMEKQFSKVKIIKKTNRFHVIAAQKG